MASIEDLGEEEQRRYVALQEHIKQQFLAGIKKDRHGKISREQEFEMPAIKLNKDKIEVVTAVSDSPPDFAALNSKLDAVIKNQSDMYDHIGTRLDAIEKGKKVDLV